MTRVGRVVRLHERPTGFPDDTTWEYGTEDVPAPREGEFVVSTTYLSLDPAMRGWLNNVRSYLPPVQLGEVMRASATGVVTDSRHPDFPVGTAVRGMFGVREAALSDGSGVVQIDPSIAAVPTWLGVLGMPGMTAYFGLLDVGRAQAGDVVLVSGAAGAVGSVVGQAAKALGCTVIGVAGGAKKCAWLREIGFDGAIDYTSENMLQRVRELAPNGVDVFFDNVGGDVLDAGLAGLARGARVVLCGAISSYNAASLPPGPSRYMSLLVFRASMTGFVVFDYADRYGEAVDQLSAWLADGTVVPRETIHKGGIDAFGEALLGLYRGVNTGKLVLSMERDATDQRKEPS